MTFTFPIIELVDRYAIAKLKQTKTKLNSNELEFYQDQIDKINFLLIQQDFDELYSIHSQIWSLEAELKSGNEHCLPLEEIGRRAIAIRNLNNKRIQLKNKMAQTLDCPIREIKKEHLSE